MTAKHQGQELVERLTELHSRMYFKPEKYGDDDTFLIQDAINALGNSTSLIEAQQAELRELHHDNGILKIDKEHLERNFKQADQCAHEREIQLLAKDRELASLREMVPVEALRIAIICLKHNAEIAASVAINSLCDDEVVVKNRYAKRQILTAQAIEQFLAALPHPPASEGEKI